MSDEAAFLAALKVNPTDDTARLVYADWLDEHNEPQKAEYLRGVVKLVSVLQTSEWVDSPGLKKVVALASALPVDWRIATAARFGLVLQTFEPGYKIEAIKLIREITGIALGGAKYFVENAPSRFPLYTTPESAEGFRQHFKFGQVLIDSAPLQLVTEPITHITFCPFVSLSARPINRNMDFEYPPEALSALGDFLASSLSLTTARANELAQQLEAIQLATELEHHQLEPLLRNLQALLPSADPEQEWEIVLQVCPLLHPQLSLN